MLLNLTKDLKFYAWLLFAGILGGCIVLWVSASYQSKSQIACVNVNKLIAEYIAKNKQNEISDANLTAQTSRFIGILEQTMKSYALKHKMTLIVSEAIITGAIDVTNDIRVNLEERLNG